MIFLLTGMLFCNKDISAQTPLRQHVIDKIASLKSSGVDTIINYHPYCVGCVFMAVDTTKCNSYDREYLIWKKGGQGFVQLFDVCYQYLPEHGAKSFIEILTKNLATIIKEDLKPVQFKEVINGKVQLLTSWLDHSDHRDFVFYVAGKIIKKPVDKYYLDARWEGDYFRSIDDKRTTSPPGKSININYASNQKTYLKKLIDLAEQEIEKITFKKSP